MEKVLFIGGLVAAGFDSTGKYLLAISHDGRGVFATDTWERIARDRSPAYPENDHAIGIGPIEGQRVCITEIDYKTGELRLRSPDGTVSLEYQSGSLTVTAASR